MTKVLPPIVSGVEGKHLKLEELGQIDFEFLGYLLSCHLVVEHHLTEFLMTLGTDLRWEAGRLTFSQKVALFPRDIMSTAPEIAAGMKHLNTLRNKVGHNIRARAGELDFEPLRAVIRVINEKVGKGEREEVEDVPKEPLAILERFTLLVCSGFIGWCASDAFRTDWRNKRKMD